MQTIPTTSFMECILIRVPYFVLKVYKPERDLHLYSTELRFKRCYDVATNKGLSFTTVSSGSESMNSSVIM